MRPAPQVIFSAGGFRWFQVNFGRLKTGQEYPLGYGVIGSTTDSGSVSLGSSPGTPAQLLALLNTWFECFVIARIVNPYVWPNGLSAVVFGPVV